MYFTSLPKSTSPLQSRSRKYVRKKGWRKNRSPKKYPTLQTIRRLEEVFGVSFFR